MTLIKGIDVILIDKIQNGVDSFNHPIFVDSEIVVKNVLVAPASTDDITNSVNSVSYTHLTLPTKLEV